MDGWSNQPPMDETKRSLTRVSVSKILKANLLLFSLGLEIEFSGLYVYGWRRGGQLQIQMTMAKFDSRVSGNCCCSDVKSRSGIFKQVESSLVTFPQCLKIAKKGLSLECKQACFYLMMWCAKIQTNVGIFLS